MDTKTRIMREAKKYFSSKGYEGLRMDTVAASCGINKATIYYYFSGKSLLYNQVIKETLEASIGRLHDAVDESGTPCEQLRQFMLVMIKSDPQDVRLIHRAMIDSAAHISEETFSLLFSVKIMLNGILESGIGEGVFENAHSFVLMQLIMGTINSYILNGAFRSKALSLVGDDPELNQALNIGISQEEFADELYAMVMKAIGAVK